MKSPPTDAGDRIMNTSNGKILGYIIKKLILYDPFEILMYFQKEKNIYKYVDRSCGDWK